VRIRKSSRYAFFAAFEMARAAGDPVTVAFVAERHGFPPSVLAKVFQRLVRGGIAAGTRGQYGGYRLAKPADSVTLLDVLDAIDPPPVRPGDGEPRSSSPIHRVLARLEVAERGTLAYVRLSTLANSAALTTLSSPSDGRGRPAPGDGSAGT